MALKVYYDKDADQSLVKGYKIGIVGYGSQAHAHAQNLRDSGVSEVRIALQPGSSSAKRAESAGFTVSTPTEIAKWADLVMILVPDEVHGEVWENELKDNMKQGSTLAVAHGFSVHFGSIKPRADMDVVMIAPKGPGHTVRSEYSSGGGVPCLVAVSQDASGKALDIALSYACAVGGGRSGIIGATFKDECETDLFGEQTVLCGSLYSLIRAGFETLVDAGYPEEMAYFECVHELKLVVDLIYQGGVKDMMHSISNTAEYGAYVTGERIVPHEETKKRMKEVLTDIQSGKFAREWLSEYGSGSNQDRYKNLKKHRESLSKHAIESVGTKLRNMMPWITKNKLMNDSNS